ncbi:MULTISPECIES: sigma-54 interaction domain-containing protein [Fusobacterium]|uniref:sigma-54 interaction domain-containing protein n=1 Tax=Fusobacterium TaxID=848 RepID=UPI002475F4CE|nr:MULTISPECIES: sigma 54-interacting transcriptional regulator [Fusobacterium]MDH6458283.1 transcriptional regulator with PAS, ATPase and Fis domain [Fusobacterium sp. PH5-7]MEE0137142.1 sigma 54-interacting transcriptional regulator [Fusobacterium ulcerans]
MEISLLDIKEHVKKYASAISSLINVDVGIVDKNMVRVTGTGLYKNIEGVYALGSVYKNSLETGKTNIIENPRQHDLCTECLDKNKCREKLEIATPIYCRDEIVGVIGLVCFSDEQKKKILSDIDSYLSFTKQIAEFIGIKFYEYQENLMQKDRESTLNTIIDNISKGVIISDCNDVIININNIASAKLKLKSDVLGKTMKLVSQNDYLMNEEVFNMVIENEEYNVAGKIIPLKSFNKTRSNAFVFEDVKKISRNILEMTSSDNMITLENIYGTSAATQSLKENIQKIANTNSTVLITGESGTGKELVARSLHSHGNRRNKPFVVINCSAIPDTLLESELFGYVKGAFTGASQNGRMGKFELANTGVIFLDEIGDMPLYLQAKILRVIQEKKIERIGSNKSIDLDIKIIAATNVDLEKKIMEQKFRGDLYYRLNVIPIKLLPLRERKEDIIPIINSLIDKYNRLSDKYVHSIDEDVKKALINYEWPGNVRELENVMELMISMSGSNGVISSDLLPDNILHHFDTAPSSVEELILNDKSELEDFEKIEKVYIEKSLEKYGDDTESKKYIADKMSIGLTTLYRKMKKYNIK